MLAAWEQNALRSENTLTSNDGISENDAVPDNSQITKRPSAVDRLCQPVGVGRMVDKEYRVIRKEKDKQKFYAAHEADFIINDAAKRQLDKLGAPNPLPKRKAVVAEIQSLVSQKNECYNDYREKSDRLHELMTVQRNYQLAMQPQQPRRSHEQER